MLVCAYSHSFPIQCRTQLLIHMFPKRFFFLLCTSHLGTYAHIIFTTVCQRWRQIRFRIADTPATWVVEIYPAYQRGFRDGCCQPTALHRLCRQLNDNLSACRRFWWFDKILWNMITQQVARSSPPPGDDAGCLSRFGEKDRSGRKRQAGTFPWVPC